MIKNSRVHDCLRVIQAPELDRAVLTARSQPVPAGIKSHRIDVMGVTFQGLHFAPGLHIPDLDGFIPTSGSQPKTVRAKSNAGYIIPMTGQGMDLAAGG